MSDPKEPFPTDSTMVIFPCQMFFGIARPRTQVIQMAVRRVSGGTGNNSSWWLWVLLHIQWLPTIPAAHQPIQGQTHLFRLAGGFEAGDVVIDRAGAEPGAGFVCVPALPNLWSTEMQQKLGSQRLGPQHPKLLIRFASVSDSLHRCPLSAFWLLGLLLSPQHWLTQPLLRL